MRFPWLAALCLTVSAPTYARPYTIDDLLRLESYGQVVVDPAGRWAVIERRDRFDSAPAYQYDWGVRRLLSKLVVLDLANKGTSRPLFAQARDAGYWSGGFSPSGRRLSIFRLTRNRIQIGIVEMASRKVRWLGLVPDLPDAHPAPIWIDEDRLLIVTLDDGGLPALFQTATNAQRSSAQGWAKTALGREPSSRLLGSGRYLDQGSAYRARQIVEISLASGTQRVIARGDILDMALSGDHGRLALLTKGPPVQPDPTAPIDPAFEPRRQRLQVIDLASGARQSPCVGCDILPSLLHWAPDGAQLLFYARQDGTSWSQGRLYQFEPHSGIASAPLPPGIQPVVQIAGGSARYVAAGWAGGRPLVFAERASDHRRDWYLLEPGGATRAITSAFPSAPAELAAADATHFLAGDARGLWRGDWKGALTRIAPGMVRAQRPLLFDGHSLGTRDWINRIPDRGFALTGSGGEVRAMIEDRADQLRTQPIEQGEMVLAAMPAGLLLYGEDDHGVGTLTFADKGERRIVDRINPHLAEVEPPRRVLLHTTAADGTLLNHWLLLPPKTATPPRLVVVPYPGYPYGPTPPADSQPAMPTIMTHPLLLVGQGYAVLQPSVPLADAPSDPLPAITKELVKAVDAVQATGLVAPAKPFLVGHSYGGYTVLGVAATSDRFAAVVAADGIYDLASGYGAMDPRLDYGEIGISLTIPIGWAEGGQGRMGVPPWAAIERYARNSPFYHIEDLHIPVLLATSDLDYVPAEQAERMFLALYRQGKDAMLLRYRGESHSLISPANLRDYWSHILAFLAENQVPPGASPQ